MNPRPQQVVFFCGPDRCGKTNIVTAVSRAIGIPTFKASTEHDAFLSCKTTRRDIFINQLRYADPRVVDLLRQTGTSVLFDRGYPCEAAYSAVLGRETDTVMLWHLDHEWAKLGARIVLCTRSSYDRVVDDLDPGLSGARLQAIQDAYESFLARSRCPVLYLNVDDEDLGREVREVTAFMGLNDPVV